MTLVEKLNNPNDALDAENDPLNAKGSEVNDVRQSCSTTWLLSPNEAWKTSSREEMMVVDEQIQQSNG